MYVSTISPYSTQNTIREHALCTLLYYDIFNYPLKASEILLFLGTGYTDEKELYSELQKLKNERLIFQFGELFTVQNNEVNITRRIRGNKEADKYLEIAKRKATLIARFPFVRAVMVSGSLSKGYMDKKSDVDFFIVTEPGGLWIARTLLVTYKRVFLMNSHKHFCVNYFVDSNHLEIEEKNLFTATELATLIPLYGAEYYEKIQQHNTWLKTFFPNYRQRPLHEVPFSKSNGLQKAIERFVNFCFGKQLDSFFMKISLNRWKRLYQKEYDQADFQIAFKTKEYASKNHPNHYQQKVRDLYRKKLENFKLDLDVKWQYE